MSLFSDVPTKRVESLVWVLVYGGLLTLGLGLAVRPRHAALGAGIAAAGSVLALAGAVLVWVRSRMSEGPNATRKPGR